MELRGCGHADVRLPSPLEEVEDELLREHGVLLERVYVAKMLAGVYDLVARGRFRRGSTVVALITGPAEDPQGRSLGVR